MSSRKLLVLVFVCAALAAPLRARAQASPEASPDATPPSRDDAPTLLGYGLRGMWTGAVVGLAAGYVSTGRSYEHEEWRKLVVGAGTGALVGVGAGIAAALVDSGKPVPGTGYLVLRDTGYGSLLGAFTGAAVGALVWAGGGRAKDVLMGTSIGTIVGAGAGAGFGFFEGANRPSPRDEAAPKPSAPPSPAPAPKRNTSGATEERPLEAAPSDAPVIRLTLAVLPTRSGPPTILPGIVGRF